MAQVTSKYKGTLPIDLDHGDSEPSPSKDSLKQFDATVKGTYLSYDTNNLIGRPVLSIP